MSYQIQNFVLSKSELAARQSYKWRQYPDGVIASCVAEMDLRIAPEIHAAMARSLDLSDLSYPLRDGHKADRAVASAFASHMRRAYDWKLSPEHVVVVADLVQASYAAIKAFSEPGDGVIVQVPNYPPFREAIEVTGRRMIPLEMEWSERGFKFDLEKLEKSIDGRTRIFLLCNPQNPTGRAFSRQELEAISRFADKHNLIVVSDEIHADLVYPGHCHLPFCALSDEAAERVITLNSATKSFNIPGLRCAVMHFGTKALMQKFQDSFPPRLIGAVNNFGVDATVVAWQDGHAWLEMVRSHLLAMRDHVVTTLRNELPEIDFHVPEATYLLWLDCSKLQCKGSAAKFFLDEAKIGFSVGEAFYPAASSFVRLNFAASQSILDELLDRMINAVKHRQGR